MRGHTHLCFRCHAVWRCHSTDCTPWDDLCERCQDAVMDEFWHDRYLQQHPEERVSTDHQPPLPLEIF
jgi:hypothetical protein